MKSHRPVLTVLRVLLFLDILLFGWAWIPAIFGKTHSSDGLEFLALGVGIVTIPVGFALLVLAVIFSSPRK